MPVFCIIFYLEILSYFCQRNQEFFDILRQPQLIWIQGLGRVNRKGTDADGIKGKSVYP